MCSNTVAVPQIRFASGQTRLELTVSRGSPADFILIGFLEATGKAQGRIHDSESELHMPTWPTPSFHAESNIAHTGYSSFPTSVYTLDY